jgi:Tfp pilus assembly protein FimT
MTFIPNNLDSPAMTNTGALVTPQSVTTDENRSRLILDTAATPAVNGIDANTSLIVSNPQVIQFENVGSSTSGQVQARVANGAAWINVGSAVSAAGLVSLSDRYDQVRVVRTGTGTLRVYAQF